MTVRKSAPPDPWGRKAVRVILLCFGLFAFATGCGDVLFGPHVLERSGAKLGLALEDPLVDSQLRFFGAIWAGWGVMLVWASRDFLVRRMPLLISCGALAFGGIGRVIGAMHTGVASPLLLTFIAIEFLLPLLVLLMIGGSRPHSVAAAWGRNI